MKYIGCGRGSLHRQLEAIPEIRKRGSEFLLSMCDHFVFKMNVSYDDEDWGFWDIDLNYLDPSDPMAEHSRGTYIAHSSLLLC